MVEKAPHAAFVGNPLDFHSYILKFLQERCTLTKDDYDEDFDFGDNWNWDDTTYSDTLGTNTDDTFGTNTNDFGGNFGYDLETFFDSYTSDRSYDFDDDGFLFDNHFDSDWIGSDTNDYTSDDFSDTRNQYASDFTTGDTITLTDDTKRTITDDNDYLTDDDWQ